TYFRAIVKETDASLLDEWERMKDPDRYALKPRAERALPVRAGITTDARAFTVLVRNAMFRLLKSLARKDHEAAVAVLEPGDEPWTPGRFERALEPYWAEHGAIRLDPEARAAKNTILEPGEHRWAVKQIVTDPEGDCDWVLEGYVDVAKSDEAGRP